MIDESARRRLGARIEEVAGEPARKQGLTRRRFLQTASGAAAVFLVMNDVYGSLYEVSPAEARAPELAEERARILSNQFVMDGNTCFLRDDIPIRGCDDLKFPNYFKEFFLDSDTKVALISGWPSGIAQDWFQTNEMKAEARARVNEEAGSRRMLSHAVFAPGQPGWLEAIDRAIAELKPDSFKGYTIGKHSWRMDDEKVAYKAYEKFAKAGLVNVCVHKGLFMRDVGQAAKDWPQLNFIMCHSAYAGGKVEDARAQFEKTGRIEWVTDLAEIPSKYGVTNVYGDLGQIFAQGTVADPRVCAAMMGQLVRGLGAYRIVWGTDAVWTGSPQWQIEALRRLEIPEDMQKKYGFKPLGPADGPVKSAILGENTARIYKYERRAALATDRITAMKDEYARSGAARGNLRYGYVMPARG